MKAALVLFAASAVLHQGQGKPIQATSTANREVVILETDAGNIMIELLPDTAPKHVKNFKGLVSQGFYDGTLFHRVVKVHGRPIAIQGGDPNTVDGDPRTWGQGQPGQPRVPAEFSTILKHVRGTVSMARANDDENSATSQFFICREAEPQWDGHWSIFGRVVDGMEVVDAIAVAPTLQDSDRPQYPVRIKRAHMAGRGEPK
jgi:peptidyl-prolyl cis-trans isomerase B (cyclophilin B)